MQPVVGREEQRVAHGDQRQPVGIRGPRHDLLGQARPLSGTVAPPQLSPVRPVGRREEQRVPRDGELRVVRRQLGLKLRRRDFLDQDGPGARPVRLPQPHRVRRPGGGEIHRVPVLDEVHGVRVVIVAREQIFQRLDRACGRVEAPYLRRIVPGNRTHDQVLAEREN